MAAPRFTKSKWRLPPAGQLAVDEAVRGIAQDPLSGAPKTGRLKGIRVEKFKVGPQQLLLAYQFDAKANRLDFLDVGVHENFYRDLDRHLEGR
ncbi:MAG TPA: type II toxin-antitoxin system RelE/ParE family toxin [Candidatus Thermoplasmatota archaeon]